MIVKEGDKYVVRAHNGRSLGKFKTRAAAEKRLKQVEYFKHKEQNKG